MTVTAVSFTGNVNNQVNTNKTKKHNNVLKAAGLAVGTAAVLGGAYALGRTSPKFWIRVGGRTPDGALWDGVKTGTPPFSKGVKEGFKRLPRLVKAISNVITNKSTVADDLTKGQKIKEILKIAFKPIG
jgi:hypothetical protein